MVSRRDLAHFYQLISQYQLVGPQQYFHLCHRSIDCFACLLASKIFSCIYFSNLTPEQALLTRPKILKLVSLYSNILFSTLLTAAFLTNSRYDYSDLLSSNFTGLTESLNPDEWVSNCLMD
ncbi:MAG: hypothetical protein ACJAS9_004084, partial [Polaribacter sp.]